MAYGGLAVLYLEAHGPVHEVEVQVVQLQGLQTPGAGCFHFICSVRAFSNYDERGPLFIAACRFLTAVASFIAEHRL